MHAHRVVLIVGWSLMLGCNTCMAQSRSLSFWEPKAETVAALKRAANEPDQRRYQTLRQAFVERGCTAEHMTEESFSRRGERNLVCVLPGRSSDVVMIEARYDKDAFAEEGADWQDAISLPLLFGALQAQPREHTFLFAAIGGHDAEQQFLAKKRDGASFSPLATIVLNGLGSGYPFCYSRKPAHRPASSDLCSNAAEMAAVMHLPGEPVLGNPRDSEDQRVLRRRLRLFDDRLLTNDPGESKVLLYSDLYLDQQTSLTFYAMDFDFIAWFLCRLDATVTSAANGASGTPGSR